jgi:Xaa-Pro aminopeptidase
VSDNNDSRTYSKRREALLEQLPQGLILVRGRGPDGVNPNFFYLTGIAESAGALLLAGRGTRVGVGRAHPGPDYVRGKMVRQILFLPARDALAASWGEQGAATVETVDASEIGVDAVFPTAQLEAVLTAGLLEAEELQYVRATPPSLVGGEDADTTWAAGASRRFLNVRVRDASPIVHEMRRSKDAIEVRAIERAAEVTAEALEAVMQTLRPGMREHEAEAEIARVYRSHGATHAFDPIVACGANALVLHYVDNSGTIEAGRLLLIDTGACLDGYRADVTRTVPVGGRFGKREREIYEVTLRAQEEAIALCRPGALLGDLHARAFEVIAEAGFGDFFVHGLGHHLGLDTHDVGDPHRPLEPGAVITIEPGIYVGDEGIGVRIEDDVLITKEGHRVLTRQIPKTVAEIEQRMAGGGS